MPTDAEGLRIASSSQERNSAIGNCISQIMSEQPGINRDRAIAMCISMADRAMGTRESSQPESIKRHTPK